MRVLDFVIKELRQMRRDPRLIGMIVGMPIIQLLLYGYAVSTDIRHLKTVVCDQDGSSQSRDLIRSVMASPQYFDVVGNVATAKQAQEALDDGRAQVAIVIGNRYSRNVSTGAPAGLQVLLDGSDPNAGTIAGSYLAKIVTAESSSILMKRLQTAGRSRLAGAGVDDRLQVWYNPTLQSSFSLVPGVVCVITGNLTMILSALAIVRERELGNIEQLLVTPIKNWELMLGKLIPYMLMGFINIAVILTIALLMLGVPMRGGFHFMFGISGLFMIGSLGLGLLVSTLAKTQMQASQLAGLMLMPNMMLSGFVYPIANMPDWLRPVTYVMPMRYFLTCVRGIMMKGNGYAELRVEIWSLTALSLAIFAGAVVMFRKRLD
ncbi:MAG TPA: ABC transporter permease [Fimbriimonadaceae bacterium]|nr:ABC transporter permease [Fimbriimonadaceae bacterium]